MPATSERRSLDCPTNENGPLTRAVFTHSASTQSAARSFATSASEGWTLAPSIYRKFVMMPLPSFTAVVPTYAPIVDWLSCARYVIGPNGVSTFKPLNAAASLSGSVDLAFFKPSAIDIIDETPTTDPTRG